MKQRVRQLVGRAASNRRVGTVLTSMAAPCVPLIRSVSARLPRGGVLMLHQGRCGSSVLADLLGQHEKMASYGEIFNSYFGSGRLPASAEFMLLGRRMRALSRHAVVEVKFFECQHLSILGMTAGELVTLANRCGYTRFIVLDRQNYLRKAVSTELALRRGNQWHYRKMDAAPRTTVRLDLERVFIQGKTAPLVQLFDYMGAQYQQLRSVLRGCDVLELTYEDDILGDPRLAYDKVCRWLGLPSEPARVQLSRSNAMPLREVVENWDEVVRTLANTPYAWMTNEPEAVE